MKKQKVNEILTQVAEIALQEAADQIEWILDGSELELIIQDPKFEDVVQFTKPGETIFDKIEVVKELVNEWLGWTK